MATKPGASLSCYSPKSTFVAEDVHPFAVDTSISSYEWMKIFLLGPLLLIRLPLVLLLVLLCAMFVVLSTVGLSQKQLMSAPLPSWRRYLLLPARLVARAVLFLFGFFWISVKGSRDPRAKIIVGAPHVTIFESLLFFFDPLPSPLAEMFIARLPVLNRLALAAQAIFIERSDKKSRSAAVGALKERLAKEGYPPTFVFPEGMCGNQRSLLSFKPGAFIPGVPVQPVVLRYKFQYWDPAWVMGGLSLGGIVIRSMLQFYNKVEVVWLPVYTPTDEEKRDPMLYANNVRDYMSKYSGIPTSAFGYEDMLLAEVALAKGWPLSFLDTPFATLKGQSDFTLRDARALLNRFIKADQDRDGLIDITNFATICNVPQHDLPRVFAKLQPKNQQITFREFVELIPLWNQLVSPAYLQTRLKCDSNKLTLETLKSAASQFSADVPDAELQAMFKEADDDQDGVISAEELMKSMRCRTEFLSILVPLL